MYHNCKVKTLLSDTVSLDREHLGENASMDRKKKEESENGTVVAEGKLTSPKHRQAEDMFRTAIHMDNRSETLKF